MKQRLQSRREFIGTSVATAVTAVTVVAAGSSLIGSATALAAGAVPTCAPPLKANAADEIINNLRQLKNVWHGFPVDQLTHGLQTATLAMRAGESPEIIVASLCHDMAKTVSALNHEEMAAEMLKPYLSSDTYNMLKYHGIFQGRFFWDEIDRDPNYYLKFRGERWYDLAMKFTEVYDKPAFKKDANFEPLETFIPIIRRVVGV